MQGVRFYYRYLEYSIPDREFSVMQKSMNRLKDQLLIQKYDIVTYMARIAVRNFGPLRDCDVNINKYTIFIGPQGSGKSTLARLYSSLSWIEKSIWRNSLSKEFDADKFLKIIGYLQLDEFVEPDTSILYEGSLVTIRYSEGHVVAEKRQLSSYILPKLLYIPSERSYLSISDDFLSSENLPSVFYELASDYSAARSAVGLKGFDIPVNGFRFIYSKSESSSVIIDKSSNYRIRLNHAASGIQSVLPLALVFAYHCNVLRYEEKPGLSVISVQQKARILRMMGEFIGTDDIASDNTPEMNVLKAAGITEITEDPALKRQLIRELRRIFDFRLSAIIEEPEQNLFPLAQKELVEFLVRETNEGDGSLLLTTHSPYVLSVLNNLIFAGEHSRKKGINEIISKSLQIRYKEISAYYFSDGSCSSIMDSDMRCINPENIDSCSVDINHTYSLMENIVYGC